ncbi:amino acid adenylation domain-containing protein [Microbispora sp. NPDC046973]|uniref:amino acid adenylation domain-containing protein n=1 Tax=Microbispora sp. NPDC046973 TaxID=3155022 RepID=UPI0033EF6415
MTERLLDEWFLDGLARDPGGPALRVHAVTLSYAEVDRRARAWAAALTEGGRAPRRVGLLANKSPEAYIGLLATLYAGAAAVPLGLEAPAERNAEIARTAGVDCLVVDAGGAAQAARVAEAAGVRVVLAADAAVGVRAGVPVRVPGDDDADSFRPPSGRTPQDVAYVLFTSGSTGRPKGVPIAHRNVSAFLRASLPRYDVGPGDRFSQVYDLTFDLAMFDIFMAWGSGACVCALTRLQALDPARYVRSYGLTLWHATPSLVNAVRARGALAPGSLAGLRYAVFCGEPLPVETARAMRAAAPDAALDNIYGPTELTIACTAYRWPAGEPLDWEGETVPIGYPNDGMDFLMLGPDAEPDQRTGELCMTGPQMFRGYLDPANDAGRFHQADGRTWYRTGDRVRLDDKAGLVHLGRDDSQVKIQGYRVELAEVEHALREAAPGCDPLVFALDDETGTVLVAFVAGGGADTAALAELAARLADRLPPYMLPRHLWPLEEMPLNRNGKADRAALRERALRRLGAHP